MIRAVDVSSHNRVDYAALARAGVRCAWIKISEGGDLDGRAAEHARGFRGEGVLIGGYPFEYAPRDDQAEAARIFCDALWTIGATDLRPPVDFESFCSSSKRVCVTPAVALAHTEALGYEIEQLLSAEIAVYTGPSFWGSIPHAASSWLCERSLWVADYRGELADEWTPLRAPTLPSGWTRAAAHQFSDGKTHELDHSVIFDLDAVTWLDVVRGS